MNKKRNMHKLHKVDEEMAKSIAKKETNEDVENMKLMHQGNILFYIISYSYRANYKDGIQVILGFPQTHIGYHVNRETLLRLGVVISNSLIRLSDNSSVEPEGFNEFQDYMGSLGVTYDVSKKLKLKGDFLYAMKRDLRTYNKDAKEMDTYAIEPTAGLMLKMIFEF